MKNQKLKLEDYELDIIINALEEFRDKLKKDNKETYPVDELLHKIYENIKESDST